MMHPVDRAAALLFRYGPKSLKVFRDGWGPDELLAAFRVTGAARPASIEIAWEAARMDGEHLGSEGTFPSPAADLPQGARTAHVRRIAPHRPDGRLVVMMAAWNDHGYRTRSALAHLLADRGVTTIMLENPFYGERRVHPEPPIRTVAEFAVMGRAAVEEGLALLAHFASDHLLGVTGYSMGGNTAALIGALMDQPVAIAGLAASHSPGPVWLDGILVSMIDWDALGGPCQADRLRGHLTAASVLAVPPPNHAAGAVIVGGRSDGYIPRTAIEDLHTHWPGSELRWLPGGHATMIWLRKEKLVDAVTDAFARTFPRSAF